MKTVLLILTIIMTACVAAIAFGVSMLASQLLMGALDCPPLWFIAVPGLLMFAMVATVFFIELPSIVREFLDIETA